MRKIILFGFAILCQNVFGQKDIRSFIFGHSLINHEFQINPTPSQETSVPYWFKILANEAGHSYDMSGQYGFLPQHADLPPFAQWGFDNIDGAWDSDNEPFSAVDFTDILITPGNFIQWKGPTVDYVTDNTSPIEATNSIFSWCNNQEENLKFYIYENWPDMGGYLSNGFPPTPLEFENYNQYLNTDFHDWFIEYHDILINNFPNSCIKMIPVGPIISQLLRTSPFDQIAITELYEDDAPHGRANTYFLASLITYMAMYEEPAPLDFIIDPIIDPIIINNYPNIVEIIWNSLNEFNINNNESRVFCNKPIVNNLDLLEQSTLIDIFPNPVMEIINIETDLNDFIISLYNAQGRLLLDKRYTLQKQLTLNISDIENGLYFMIIRDKDGKELLKKNILKLD